MLLFYFIFSSTQTQVLEVAWESFEDFKQDVAQNLNSCSEYQLYKFKKGGEAALIRNTTLISFDFNLLLIEQIQKTLNKQGLVS